MSHDDTRDEQLSRLYREAAGEEPSEAMDRAILAAARAEAAPVQPRKRAWWQTWAAPAGVAVTVVLTVTLTLMVQQEQELPAPKAPPAKTDEVDPAVKPSVPQIKANQEDARPEAERPVEPPRPAQPPWPAPMPLAREKKAEPVAPSGAVAPRAPMAESAESAAPAIPAAEMRRQAAPAADAVELRAKSAPLRKEAVGAAPARTPEQWLEDIRRLKQQGKDKEAAAALADFRKAYPDFRLPDDLR